MANFRVEYAHQGIKINNAVVHGVQSATLNTTFNLEQVFELGQLEIYENIETLPDVTLTIEKVLDGYPLLLERATEAASTDTLIDRSNQRCDIEIFIYPDSQTEAGSASSAGVAAQVTLTDMYVTNITYNMPLDGNFTESITFEGNDKSWNINDYIDASIFGEDTPADTVKRRQHIVMGSTPGTSSVWPKDITGIDSSGYNILDGANGYSAHIGDITISVSLTREDFYEQGSRKPYYKRAQFPTEVSLTISEIAGGNDPGDGIDADSDSESNIVDSPVVIRLSDGTVFDLGTKVRLNSIDWSGGDTGGGVLSYARNYTTYNVFDITSPLQS